MLAFQNTVKGISFLRSVTFENNTGIVECFKIIPNTYTLR